MSAWTKSVWVKSYPLFRLYAGSKQKQVDQQRHCTNGSDIDRWGGGLAAIDKSMKPWVRHFNINGRLKAPVGGFVCP